MDSRRVMTSSSPSEQQGRDEDGPISSDAEGDAAHAHGAEMPAPG